MVFAYISFSHSDSKVAFRSDQLYPHHVRYLSWLWHNLQDIRNIMFGRQKTGTVTPRMVTSVSA